MVFFSIREQLNRDVQRLPFKHNIVRMYGSVGARRNGTGWRDECIGITSQSFDHYSQCLCLFGRLVAVTIVWNGIQKLSLHISLDTSTFTFPRIDTLRLVLLLCLSLLQ